VTLSACGDSKSASSAPASKQAQTPGIQAAIDTVTKYTAEQPELDIPPLSKRPPQGKKIHLVWCTLPTCQENAGKRAFEMLGWHAKIFGYDLAKGPQGVVAAFDAALRDKPDYVMIAPVFPWVVVKKQIAAARKQGTQVVGVSGTDDWARYGVAACIACAPQYYETGALQVDAALADARSKTGIVYANDPTVTGGNQILEGARREAKAHGDGSTFDTLNLSAAKTPADNATTVVSYVQRHPEVRYLITSINDLIVGVPAALSTAGLAGRLTTIGGTPQLPDLGYLRRGTMRAAVAHENGTAQWRAVDFLARIAVGDPRPKDMLEPTGWHQIINKANVPNGLPVPTRYEETYAKAWRVQ
jgi:ABC-type sugar transport system substrate-binding protein